MLRAFGFKEDGEFLSLPPSSDNRNANEFLEILNGEMNALQGGKRKMTATYGKNHQFNKK